MGYEYPVIKLLEYQDRWEELAAIRNIFAVVVMAYLKTRETRGEPESRLRWKSRLVRLLYERRYSREEVISLFGLIDWMMHLPDKQAILFEADLESLEAEHHMPYLTSIERRALERGRNEGLERGRNEGLERGRNEGLEKGQAQGRLHQLRKLLEHRFGPLPEWTTERLGKATPSLLDDWALRLLDARRVEDVFGS